MVDERRGRIPQPWLWVLAGVALVFVFVFAFVVAPLLLIGNHHSGLNTADELKARNDIRTTLVQALAGLAVAGGLVVTYRTYQQNRAEQDRTYDTAAVVRDLQVVHAGRCACGGARRGAAAAVMMNRDKQSRSGSRGCHGI